MTNPPPGNAVRRSPLADRLFGWAAQGAAWLTLALLAGILVSLVIGAWPAISKYGLGFLTSSVWDPVKGEYGGLVMIYGTIATSLIALVIAVPVSFGIALFLTEQPGKDSWPITGATFILMQKVQDKPAQAAASLKFFEWAYKNGDKTADDLDYVPMPANVKAIIEKSWAEIKDASGKAVAYK